MELNAAQKSAITCIDAPLLVLAGAGSGKTRVITQKIAYLIQQCGRRASNIVALTFTNKAAKEMAQRVGAKLDSHERRGLSISTFHTFGLTFLKKEIELSGLRAGFSILDGEDCLALIKSLLPKKETEDKATLLKVQSVISNWKSALIEPSQASMMKARFVEEELAAKIYADYAKNLTAYNACDFDDLIRIPVKLLQSNKELLEKWRQKVHYLLVDEYQDTNASQYQLIKLLMGERQTFTVVGDDDQSIYAWRGAIPENLQLLQTDFPALKVIKLEQNYRSSGCILECANHLISHNSHLFEKKLWSGLGFGELVRVIRVIDEFSEARQVAAEIISHKLQHKTSFGDYAILYRGNHQSRLFEKALRDKTIPYQITGGQSFFSKSEIKDLLAFYRLIANHNDDNAFLRVINIPKRGVGLTTIEKLTSFASDRGLDCFRASKSMAFGELVSTNIWQSLKNFCEMIEKAQEALSKREDLDKKLSDVLTLLNYEHHLFESIESSDVALKKMNNVRELNRWLFDLASREEVPLSFQDVLQKVLLIDSLGREEEEISQKVQLMTLHASKGLEFPHVYLVGLEEELLPHKNSLTEGNIEEERRLAYVGITRAQQTLTMTLALRRSRYGEVTECIPSRFLEELPERCISHSGVNKRSKEDERSSAKSHLSLLKSMLENS